MAALVPVVYLLHGDDDFQIGEFVDSMIERLGDPTTAEMNTTRLPAGSYQIEDLRTAAAAMPFLATRRLVVAEEVTRLCKGKPAQEKLISLMESLPPTAALVLVESNTLDGKNWLIKWAAASDGRAYARGFPAPRGPQLIQHIRKYAADQGGEISMQAASLLAESSGQELRAAVLEVDKLLAFVNYQRLVDVDDVEMAAAFVGGQGDYFTLIDSIAARNGRKAMDMLEKLLDEQDGLPLFFSLVGHFRLVLQAREVVENGGNDSTVAKTLGIHPYRAQKITAQARTISLSALESIYLRLQQLDMEIKTGQIVPDLALETLVLELTGERSS